MMTVFGLILSPTPRQHLEILLYISYYKLISLLALLLLCCSALVILVAVAAGTRQRGTAPPGNQELGLGHTQHTLLPPRHREARGGCRHGVFGLFTHNYHLQCVNNRHEVCC